MLINNWYVAATSDAVEVGKPMGVRMLGFDFALYRLEDGGVVCLSDVCVHRGASLSRGQCVDGKVACPFHGWQFDPKGACAKIPSMGDDAPIPRRAKIDSYPTAEKYDLVWVFLGDLPEELRPPLPDLLPEYHQTDAWRTTRMVFEADANWQKFEENSLDTAHLSFVHATFGSRINPKAVDAPLERTAFGARVKRERPAPKAAQKSGVLGALLSEEREKTSVELEFSILGVCHRINPTFRPGMSQVTFSASTPIDARNTRQFGLQARNYAIEPEHDEERLTGRRNAINEDIAVIRHVRPAIGPTSFREEVLVKSDEMESNFRHMVLRMIDAGWLIDHEQVEKTWDHKVYVIPSPARRQDPTGWAHEAAPTTRPRIKDDIWRTLAEEAGQPLNEGVAAA
ncbi:Rieske 2Fe-2S domain-containing protein [Brevundimonas faecalis]|uniref:Rieske 2Fe-2S domain-containing protein n=1 Tax=Brevundimonas faecalis TaxID=947378 RepID=UPI00361E2D33